MAPRDDLATTSTASSESAELDDIRTVGGRPACSVSFPAHAAPRVAPSSGYVPHQLKKSQASGKSSTCESTPSPTVRVLFRFLIFSARLFESLSCLRRSSSSVLVSDPTRSYCRSADFEVFRGSPGVAGLSTAVRLQEAGHHVTIVARDLPSDPKSIRFTSPWAVSLPLLLDPSRWLTLTPTGCPSCFVSDWSRHEDAW